MADNKDSMEQYSHEEQGLLWHGNAPDKPISNADAQAIMGVVTY